MPSNTPPLWVWFTLLCLLAGTLYYLNRYYCSSGTLGIESQINLFKRERQLYKVDHPDRYDCRVLVWGSSFTRQGIYNHDEFAEAILASSHQEISIEKIILHASNPNAIAYLGDHYAITDSVAPALLLIEDYTFFWKRELPFASQRNLAALKNWFHDRKYVIPNVKPLKSDKHAFDHYIRHKVPPTQSDTSRLRRSNYPFTVNTIADHQRLLEQLKLLSQKTNIIILDLPRPGPIEQFVRNTNNEADRLALMNHYAEAGVNLDYWEYPDPLPFSYYADMGHLNERGRVVYSQWLQEKILTYLADQPCQN